MTLSIKDLGTTVLAFITVALYYARVRGIDLPLLSSERIAIVALAVIGIAMCAIGGSGNASTFTNGLSNPWVLVSSVLGATALVVIVAGLITGGKLYVMLLTGIIVLMWLISTVRHLVAG